MLQFDMKLDRASERMQSVLREVDLTETGKAAVLAVVCVETRERGTEETSTIMLQ